MEGINTVDECWMSFGDHYKISSKGRILTTDYKMTGETRLMNPSLDKGYPKTVVSINGKSKTIAIHREVARLFIPNPENKKQVNHIDFNRSNNNIDNLEWVTPKENYDHSAKKGRMHSVAGTINPMKGSRNGQSKLTEHDVLEIRRKYIPTVYTRQMLADEFNVKIGTIKDILIRRSWKSI